MADRTGQLENVGAGGILGHRDAHFAEDRTHRAIRVERIEGRRSVPAELAGDGVELAVRIRDGAQALTALLGANGHIEGTGREVKGLATELDVEVAQRAHEPAGRDADDAGALRDTRRLLAGKEVELVRDDRGGERLVINDARILVVLGDPVVGRGSFPGPVRIQLAGKADDAAQASRVVQVLAGIVDQTVAGGDGDVERIAVETRRDRGATGAGIGTGRQRGEGAGVDRLAVDLRGGVGLDDENVAENLERLGPLVVEREREALALVLDALRDVLREVKELELGARSARPGIGAVGDERRGGQATGGDSRGILGRIKVVVGGANVDRAGERRGAVGGVRVRTLVVEDRVLLHELRGDRHAGPAVAKAAHHVATALGGVALVGGPAVTRAGLEALVVSLEDDVHHARNGVGAIDSGGAVGENLDPLNRGNGNHVHVDKRVTTRRADRIVRRTTAVHEHQRGGIAQRDLGATVRGTRANIGVGAADVTVAAELRNGLAQDLEHVGAAA